MCLKNNAESDVQSDNAPDRIKTPGTTIYANSGTWIDHAKGGCTYVETEETKKIDGNQLHVRVKRYKCVREDKVIYEGFVEI